jgi:tetratricopeptide (TPR) repeat protein
LVDYADEKKSDQIGLDIASNEISTFTGVDQFFAYYNRGTSLVHLQDYKGAADAYDEAFKIYANLAEVDKRPYRMTWYQTGPYYAYFYNGRYQDVIDLTTITLESTNQPYLEENYYWRARAEAALGQMDQATKDLKTSLKYHVDFSPSLDLMLQLGISN